MLTSASDEHNFDDQMVVEAKKNARKMTPTRKNIDRRKQAKK